MHCSYIERPFSGMSQILHFIWVLSFCTWLATISRTAMLKFEISSDLLLESLENMSRIMFSRNQTLALVLLLIRELP